MYQALGQTSGIESFKANDVTALFNLPYVRQLNTHYLIRTVVTVLKKK